MHLQGVAGARCDLSVHGGFVRIKADTLQKCEGCEDVSQEPFLVACLFDGVGIPQGNRILIALFSSENAFQDVVTPSCLEPLASNGALFH